MSEGKNDILILGIGNILLGDEGIGIHALNALAARSWPVNIHLLDGGTGGFHLLSVFQQYPRIILIDAALDGHSPGSIRLLKPKYAADFPQTLSAHDIGLRDLVNSSALLGFLPEIFLIIVSISDPQPVSMELSADVKKTLPEIISVTENLIRELSTSLDHEGADF